MFMFTLRTLQSLQSTQLMDTLIRTVYTSPPSSKVDPPRLPAHPSGGGGQEEDDAAKMAQLNRSNSRKNRISESKETLGAWRDRD
jgi:hypothetical protein